MDREHFAPDEKASGSARLEMEWADSSGLLTSDPVFVADRLAILNHVTAYAYLIDEDRWDDWFALFADDIAFESSAPGLDTLFVHGMTAFQELVYRRYIIPRRRSKNLRRHTQGFVHVAEQTATTAKVRTHMMISTVPAENELHLLTSGTYHAELEKRGDGWTITRWQIEADEPLEASPLVDALAPIKGHITIESDPRSTPTRAPLYANDPAEWHWQDVELVIVDYLTDAKSAAALLPAHVTTVPIPELPGYSAIKQVWARYRKTSVGPYNELMPVIPCLHRNQMYLHAPVVYVDNDAALAASHKPSGWPKQLADIRMDRIGDHYACSIERHGHRLASASMHIASILFSTPLPADKHVALPYPYSMTLALPPPTHAPHPAVPLPTTTLEVIPGVSPTSPITRLVAAPRQMTGTFSAGSSASLAYRESEGDPFHKLPILRTLCALYFEGDMTLALKDMKVLA